jgi:hypothetical protein|tara:strand:+ start:28481 stop:28618 length:138 start_codon:yes stop_codon:yes gene_type:complete
MQPLGKCVMESGAPAEHGVGFVELTAFAAQEDCQILALDELGMRD